MAGNAGALFANGFLGDLNQDFLAFLEEIGNQGQGLRLTTGRPETAPTAPTTVAIELGTPCTLHVTGGARWSANLGSSFRVLIAGIFATDQSLSFGLRFVELCLLIAFIGLFCRFGSRSFDRLAMIQFRRYLVGLHAGRGNLV